MTDNEQRIEFSSLHEDDLAQIAELISGMRDDPRLWLRNKTPAYYRWMYFENPAGRALVRSAKVGSRIVASFAVAPKVFEIHGRRVTVGKIMDMFTDPLFQGRGLMSRCMGEAFDAAEAVGIRSFYLFPSAHSYPIFKERRGYEEHVRVLFRARILRYESVLAAMTRYERAGRRLGQVIDGARRFRPRRHSVEVETINGFGVEADQLWQDVAPGFPVAIVRDATYLNWRYVTNPDEYTILGIRHEGRLDGLVVLKETLRRGVPVGEIVDIVCGADDDVTFRALVHAATDHSIERGHGLVQAYSVDHTRLDARTRAAGLRLRRSNVRFLTSPAFDGIADPESWLLAQGDGENV